MEIIEKILGNAVESIWDERSKSAQVDYLRLDQWDAQKNRFRRRTDNGQELAVSLERGTVLKNGDVLSWDEQTNTLVVAQIALKEVLVVHLEKLLQEEPSLLLRTAVELGHALGNQHWPAVVKEDRVYVPLAVDRKVMASVMKTHAFEGIEYEFVPGAEVIPYLAPHEARRLFGGAEGPIHSHSHSHEHAHGHEPAHSH